MNKPIVRGDLYYADLNPIIGSEQGGIRPVLVIQNDIGNRHSPTVIVAAVTSKKKPRLPTHIALTDFKPLEQDSVVLLEQIRTIDKQRLREYVGALDETLMQQVDDALDTSLELKRKSSSALEMTLCSVCAQQFYDSPHHYIQRKNLSQYEKEGCMFCNVRHGFDYVITSQA